MEKPTRHIDELLAALDSAEQHVHEVLEEELAGIPAFIKPRVERLVNLLKTMSAAQNEVSRELHGRLALTIDVLEMEFGYRVAPKMGSALDPDFDGDLEELAEADELESTRHIYEDQSQ